MADQDIFSNVEDKQNTSETPENSGNDPFADLLKQIKNEKGEPKYKDVNTALSALKASQDFIEQLKREKTEEENLRRQREAELERLGNIEDFVNRLKPNAKPQEKQETPANTNGLSEEKIVKMLEEKLQQKELEAAYNSNYKGVVDHLVNTFGGQEEATKAIKQKADELGVTPQELKQMAQQKPALVKALFGSSTTTSKPKPSQSSISIGTQPSKDNQPPKSEKKIIQGGLNNRELAAEFAKSKEYTNKRLGLGTQ
jgi:hypothetical protein